MDKSSSLVMEDNDLEEGKPGRQTHHMGQHGQRHGVRPKLHAMSLTYYEVGYCARWNRRAGTQAPVRNQRRPGGSNSWHRLSCEVHFATLNMGTMTGKRVDVIELLKRRQLLCFGVQETKWKGDRAVNLGEGFKLLHAGGDGKTNGVGVIINEEYSK